MEERTIAILKAVAVENGMSCHCHGKTENTIFSEATGLLDSEHKECIVDQARKELEERGIILNRYRISFEYYDEDSYSKKGYDKWRKTYIVEIGFTEKEALARFKGRKRKNKYYDADAPMRNIHISITHEPPREVFGYINPLP